MTVIVSTDQAECLMTLVGLGLLPYTKPHHPNAKGCDGLLPLDDEQTKWLAFTNEAGHFTLHGIEGTMEEAVAYFTKTVRAKHPIETFRVIEHTHCPQNN